MLRSILLKFFRKQKFRPLGHHQRHHAPDMSHRFVAGETLEEALQVAARL